MRPCSWFGGGSSSPSLRLKLNRSSPLNRCPRNSSAEWRCQAASIRANSASVSRARSTPEISPPTVGVRGVIDKAMAGVLLDAARRLQSSAHLAGESSAWRASLARAGGSAFPRGGSAQPVEQSLGLAQIARLEALGEGAVDRRQKLARLPALALAAPQEGQARCRAQLP